MKKKKARPFALALLIQEERPALSSAVRVRSTNIGARNSPQFAAVAPAPSRKYVASPLRLYATAQLQHANPSASDDATWTSLRQRDARYSAATARVSPVGRTPRISCEARLK